MRKATEEEIVLFDKMHKKCVQIVKKSKDLTPLTGQSQVACVIIGESGKMYKGLNVGWWHSSCAEHIALSNAWQGGERKLQYLTAVKLDKDNDKIKSIAPCGICREMFNKLQPDVNVVVWDDDGYYKIYTIAQILPDVDDC